MPFRLYLIPYNHLQRREMKYSTPNNSQSPLWRHCLHESLETFNVASVEQVERLSNFASQIFICVYSEGTLKGQQPPLKGAGGGGWGGGLPSIFADQNIPLRLGFNDQIFSFLQMHFYSVRWDCFVSSEVLRFCFFFINNTGFDLKLQFIYVVSLLLCSPFLYHANKTVG